jgi:hypothetical protein
MQRELQEETGIEACPHFFKTTYVAYKAYNMLYHMYHIHLGALPTITINPVEHQSYIRRTPFEALQENLIQDEDVCIRMFYGV